MHGTCARAVEKPTPPSLWRCKPVTTTADAGHGTAGTHGPYDAPA
jgi:hypothetical protein